MFDAEEAVRGYFAASRTAFPDQGNEIISIDAGSDTVLVEFWLTERPYFDQGAVLRALQRSRIDRSYFCTAAAGFAPVGAPDGAMIPAHLRSSHHARLVEPATFPRIRDD